MVFYSSMIKNEIMTHVGKWIELEFVKQSNAEI